MSAHPRALPVPLALRLPAAVTTALAAFAVSRLVVLVAGAAAHAAFGDRPRSGPLDPGALSRPFGSGWDALVAPFAGWDSVWLLVIANDAYAGEGPREAFFPLYPMLTSALGSVVGSPLAAGVLLSSACAVAGMACVHRLAELELGPRAARWAVWGLALCPVSFFLSAVYSEALFLALSAGALLAARTDRFAVAGALGALAAGTRSAGVVLLVPLVLLWWRSPARRPRDLGWVALVPAGLLAFMAGLWLAGESPWAPFTAQEAWRRAFAGPFAAVVTSAVAAVDALDELGRPAPRHDVALFASLIVVAWLLLGVWRRLPRWHAAYAVAALALPLSWPVPEQPLMSLPRFALVLVPLVLFAGLWLAEAGPARRAAWLGVSGAGLAVCTGLFATWHWVA